MVTALEEAGALRVNAVAGGPRRFDGGPVPGDEDFTTRHRPAPRGRVGLAACAEATAGVTVRRGVAVAGVTTGTSGGAGVPHVTGVRTEAGEEIAADLVVDATGRRSPLPHWLEAEPGRARPVEELEDSGFVYYGRHFRSADGLPPPIMARLCSTTGASRPDAAGRQRHVGRGRSSPAPPTRPCGACATSDRWTTAVRALPLAAHWLDGEALTTGSRRCRRSRTASDTSHRRRAGGHRRRGGGRLVGLHQPVARRGASHRACFTPWPCATGSATSGVDDPLGFVRAFGRGHEAAVEPWTGHMAFDRHRLAQIEAEIEGGPTPPDDPAVGDRPRPAVRRPAGPDCFRGLLE